MRHSHRHSAQAQQGTEAVGGDAVGGSHRRHRGHGLHHAVRSPAVESGRGQAGVRTRGRAAGGQRTSQVIDSGASLRWRSRAWIFDRLISIRIPIGGNGNDRATALSELFARKHGETEVRLRLEEARDFSVILDVTTRRYARIRSSRRKWSASAARRRWKCWQPEGA